MSSNRNKWLFATTALALLCAFSFSVLADNPVPPPVNIYAQPEAAIAGAVSDAANAVFDGAKIAGWLTDRLIAFFIGLVNTGVVAIVAALSLFIMILGRVLMYIGLTFGPLLIALAPFRLTRSLALKWMEFMFGAMMYSAVAMAVMGLTNSMFIELQKLQGSPAQISVPSFLLANISVMVAVLAGFIMWQVPSITSHLFGGMTLSAPRLPKPKMPKPKMPQPGPPAS